MIKIGNIEIWINTFKSNVNWQKFNMRNKYPSIIKLLIGKILIGKLLFEKLTIGKKNT